MIYVFAGRWLAESFLAHDWLNNRVYVVASTWLVESQ